MQDLRGMMPNSTIQYIQDLVQKQQQKANESRKAMYNVANILKKRRNERFTNAEKRMVEFTKRREERIKKIQDNQQKIRNLLLKENEIGRQEAQLQPPPNYSGGRPTRKLYSRKRQTRKH